MRWFLNLSIKYKLLIMLSVSSIVPILILGIYAYHIGAKMIDTEATYASQIALNRIAANLDLNLHQLDSYSTMIAQSQAVQAALSAPGGLSEAGRTAVADEMSASQKHTSTPFKALLITAGGEAVYNFSCLEGSIDQAVETIMAEDWFPGGKVYESPLRFLGGRESYIPHFEAQDHYYFYKAISDESNAFLGLLLIDLNAYTFDRQLSSVVDADDRTIYLTDAAGQVIFSPPHAPASAEALVRSGEARIEASASLQIFPWSMQLLRDERATHRGMAQLIPFTVVLIVTVLSVEVLLFFFFDRTISRPLIRLRNAVDNLTQNDFQIPCQIYAQDEIGGLTKGVSDMAAKIQRSIQTIKDEERQMEKLEFLMLQAQINPHFLYNTLNSIMLIADFMGCANISHAIACLIKLLQYSIDNFDNEITLQEEIDYLESYVDLSNIRFKNKIRFLCDVPEELRQQPVVKFLFQPLVENAIVHGLRSKVGMGTVHLQIRQEGGTLVGVVDDNGVGMSPEALENIWTLQEAPQYDRLHIGIPNIDKRIKLVYGTSYGLHIESKPESGTRVTLTIPIRGRRSYEDIDRG